MRMVKAYQRKNGSPVKAHARKGKGMPGTKTASGSAKPVLKSIPKNAAYLDDDFSDSAMNKKYGGGGDPI